MLWHSTRRRCRVGILIGLLAAFGAASFAADDATNEEREARMKRDITFLASDECEGRGIETKGIEIAANFIAGEFASAGLKPGGLSGSYFQPFAVQGQSKLEGTSTLNLKGPLQELFAGG